MITIYSDCTAQLSALEPTRAAVEPAPSSIVVFSVIEDPSQPKATQLKAVGFTSDLISWPRGMSLSPNEQHVIAANQKGEFGSTLTVFDRDQASGLLTLSATQKPIACPNPTCIDWVR